MVQSLKLSGHNMFNTRQRQWRRGGPCDHIKLSIKAVKQGISTCWNKAGRESLSLSPPCHPKLGDMGVIFAPLHTGRSNSDNLLQANVPRATKIHRI